VFGQVDRCQIKVKISASEVNNNNNNNNNNKTRLLSLVSLVRSTEELLE